MQITDVTVEVPACVAYDKALDAWVKAARLRGLRAYRIGYPISDTEGSLGEWNCGMVTVNGVDHVLYVPLDEAADPDTDPWIIRGRPSILEDYIRYHYVRPCVEIRLTLTSPLTDHEVERLELVFALMFDEITISSMDWPTLEICPVDRPTQVNVTMNEQLLSATAMEAMVTELVGHFIAEPRGLWPHLRFAAAYFFRFGVWPSRRIALALQ